MTVLYQGRTAIELRVNGHMRFVCVRPSDLLLDTLRLQLGLTGVWIALCSDGVICFLLARYRFLKGKWETIKV